MSDSEKWAWWTVCVVAVTVAAYGALYAFVGHHPGNGSVFALLALTALPKTSRRAFRHRVLDEREREIAGKAMRAGFSVCWTASIGIYLAIGFGKGWDSTLVVPVWALSEALMLALCLIMAVQAITTIVLYRGGPSHA
jgi:hypothetical protein